MNNTAARGNTSRNTSRNINIGILGDWGNNCNIEQTKVLDDLKDFEEKEGINMIVSVGDMLYHNDIPKEETLDDNINNGLNCIVERNLNSMPWLFALGNHDEESFGFSNPCLYRNRLIENINAKFNNADGQQIYKDMLNKYVDNGFGFSEDTTFKDSHNLVFLIINTNIFELKDKKDKKKKKTIQPGCTYELNKRIINLFKDKSLTTKEDLSDLQEGINDYFLKGKSATDLEEKLPLLDHIFDNIDTMKFLRDKLYDYDQINSTLSDNDKIRVIIVGHHPIIMKGHKSDKLNKYYGNVFMRFIYENVIRKFKCCIAYLCGHEHGLQYLEDTINTTVNGDTFKFIISGSGGGNEELNNYESVNNSFKAKLNTLMTDSNYNSILYLNNYGYFVININNSNEITFYHKIVEITRPNQTGNGNRNRNMNRNRKIIKNNRNRSKITKIIKRNKKPKRTKKKRLIKNTKKK